MFIEAKLEALVVTDVAPLVIDIPATDVGEVTAWNKAPLLCLVLYCYNDVMCSKKKKWDVSKW